MPQPPEVQDQIRRAGRRARGLGWSVALVSAFGMLHLLARLLPAGLCPLDLGGMAGAATMGAGPLVDLSRSVLYGPFFSVLAAGIAALCGLVATAAYCEIRICQLQPVLAALSEVDRASVLRDARARADTRYLAARLQEARRPHLELSPAAAAAARGDEVGSAEARRA